MLNLGKQSLYFRAALFDSAKLQEELTHHFQKSMCLPIPFLSGISEMLGNKFKYKLSYNQLVVIIYKEQPYFLAGKSLQNIIRLIFESPYSSSSIHEFRVWFRPAELVAVLPCSKPQPMAVSSVFKFYLFSIPVAELSLLAE